LALDVDGSLTSVRTGFTDPTPETRSNDNGSSRFHFQPPPLDGVNADQTPLPQVRHLEHHRIESAKAKNRMGDRGHGPTRGLGRRKRRSGIVPRTVSSKQRDAAGKC